MTLACLVAQVPLLQTVTFEAAFADSAVKGTGTKAYFNTAQHAFLSMHVSHAVGTCRFVCHTQAWASLKYRMSCVILQVMKYKLATPMTGLDIGLKREWLIGQQLNTITGQDGELHGTYIGLVVWQ